MSRKSEVAELLEPYRLTLHFSLSEVASYLGKDPATLSPDLAKLSLAELITFLSANKGAL